MASKVEMAEIDTILEVVWRTSLTAFAQHVNGRDNEGSWAKILGANKCLNCKAHGKPAQDNWVSQKTLSNKCGVCESCYALLDVEQEVGLQLLLLLLLLLLS